jgi:hypothetical protein
MVDSTRADVTTSNLHLLLWTVRNLCPEIYRALWRSHLGKRWCISMRAGKVVIESLYETGKKHDINPDIHINRERRIITLKRF